jgi:hypothetical protein
MFMALKVAVLGIDLGKNSCSLVGLDEVGAVVTRRRMRPQSIPAFTSTLPACVVAMEACCGAHHLGRLLAAQGHTVRLMSPEYVRPYVKSHKNDDRDAEAIAEAATRPTMRFVEPKSQRQLDMQTLHRARDRLVGERTALINQLRAILLERGQSVPQGRRKLEQYLVAMLEPDSDPTLSPRMRQLIEDTRAGPADHRLRQRVCCPGSKRSGSATARDNPRYRRAECNGAGRCDRQRPDLCARARPRGLARVGAAPGDYRRQTPASRYHQTRQQVPSQAADPRRASGLAEAG